MPDDPRTKKAAVVILNWNAYADTERCIRTVLQSEYPGAYPVVVDNASTDGSYEQLVREFPEVQILRAPDNMGYAAGNNVGLRRALLDGAEYLFVINNDTEVPPHCVGTLVELMEADPSIGQLGPLVDDATTGRIGCLGGRIEWSMAEPRHIGGGEEDRGQFAEMLDVDYVPGTAVMVRRAALEQVGLIPEQYFIYFEDTVWSILFQRAGWKTRVTPAARITHWESSTMGRNSPRKVYYSIRNNLAFMEEFTPPEWRAGVQRRYHWKLAKLVVKNLLQGGVAQVAAMSKGYRDYRAGRMWKTDRTF